MTDPSNTNGDIAELTDDKSRSEYAHEVGDDDRPAAPGERVRDRTGGSKLRVIARTERTARKWGIAATGKSVAEHNPGFDADDDVLLAAYESDLDETFGDSWHALPATLLAFRVGDLGVKTYSFPSKRLARVEDEWPVENETDEEGADGDE